ncbi:hypothetical protein CSAL01_08557 [Colletotrichum salicis]|uniref:Uncharacterized protein n=1 Tax=Colletotrichum salicis TaxID=1209931 RepID=A0A135V8S0_9PEZI|nr:hypothetical protein CSAL01_08557 [Colletotrichum salicis]
MFQVDLIARRPVLGTLAAGLTLAAVLAPAAAHDSAADAEPFGKAAVAVAAVEGQGARSGRVVQAERLHLQAQLGDARDSRGGGPAHVGAAIGADDIVDEGGAAGALRGERRGSADAVVGILVAGGDGGILEAAHRVQCGRRLGNHGSGGGGGGLRGGFKVAAPYRSMGCS